MIVYCNSGFSKDISEKNYYVAKFLGGLIYHFQDLTFGESVKEIVHYMACGTEDYLRYLGVGMTYSRRNRSLGSLFTISYDKVKKSEGKALLEYISEELLTETARLEMKAPKKFDLNAYKTSLSIYLNEALTIVLSEGDPSSKKTLSDDIQQAMNKKWSRL